MNDTELKAILAELLKIKDLAESNGNLALPARQTQQIRNIAGNLAAKLDLYLINQ